MGLDPITGAIAGSVVSGAVNKKTGSAPSVQRMPSSKETKEQLKLMNDTNTSLLPSALINYGNAQSIIDNANNSYGSYIDNQNALLNDRLNKQLGSILNTGIKNGTWSSSQGDAMRKNVADSYAKGLIENQQRNIALGQSLATTNQAFGSDIFGNQMKGTNINSAIDQGTQYVDPGKEGILGDSGAGLFGKLFTQNSTTTNPTVSGQVVSGPLLPNGSFYYNQ